MIVTFDLFSALTDSRRGGSAFFADLAARHGWELTGEQAYDRWDRHNKALQRTARAPETFHEVSLRALTAAYAELGLPVDRAGADLAALEDSVADWPLWPDVAPAVRAVAERHRVGLLSNVDDPLARRTRAHALVDPELVLTSQRLGAYKPDPEIYRAAARAVAPEPLVHVAASGRDVRGALEAGLATVRLVRPGHVLDAAGPRPPLEIEDAADLLAVLEEL
ncbi:HAD-IA family hydrolase [Nocardioides pantholopis]|uniref:HAD-IA family hydrolase n=1 Tax=Nocardioides pantholopis TaxID=2483798 RepID=UPI000FD8FB75|nr:HAD-IA family hydrolase [Nocardioides pantholopis]